MLRGIHKASSNWIGRAIMGVVLGLIAISFGIWGIADIFRGFGTSTLAKVGGTEIRIDTVRQLYQERVQQLSRQLNQQIPPDQAKAFGIDRQVLYDTIAEVALDERTRKLGLNLSDADVAKAITSIPELRGINGQFDRNTFNQLLRNKGYSEARYMDEQRRLMLRQQLLSTLTGDLAVPKTALDAFNRFQNEQRTIEYVALGAAQAGDIPDPTPEALAKYFEERKVIFRSPEYRKVTVVMLRPEDLAAQIEVSDKDLKDTYANRKARYETPERRHLKQIVFPSMEEAKAAADKLAKGTTFEALAAERNLKDTDIDLGTVAKSAVVDREVADAAFALKSGEVSAPVQGRFGIAIVKVDAIEPGTVKPFEEVAPEIKREIQNDRARNEMTNVQEKVEDERLGGATLADAARKFGLKPITIEAIDRNGKDAKGNPVSDLPQNADVLSAAFAADVHGENEPLKLPNNAGYVWYDVDATTAARERPLDEVKDEVIGRWRDDEVAARLKTKATEMLDKAKAGTPFADVAAPLKVEWRPGIKRGAPTPGLSPAAVNEVFKTPQDGVASVEGASPTERIVFHVSEIKVPPLEPEAEETKRIDEALKQRSASDLAAQYLASVESDVGVTINDTALNQVTGGSQN